MQRALEGKKIVIAGSRKIDEMSALIEKRGGSVLVRPLQGTVFLNESELADDLRRLAEQGADWIVFTTGIGLETLVAQAEKMGIREAFQTVLQQARVAARGYKTVGALKKLEKTPDVIDDDGTTQGLIRALQPVDLQDQKVFVQLHGEPVPVLIEFLAGKGAVVEQILPYRHIAPAIETVSSLCQEIADEAVDAVCFTTAVQVRYLFQYAHQHGIAERLIRAFHDRVLAVSVGKVTSEALREEGLERILSPESERMGAMVVEIGDYFKSS